MYVLFVCLFVSTLNFLKVLMYLYFLHWFLSLLISVSTLLNKTEPNMIKKQRQNPSLFYSSTSPQTFVIRINAEKVPCVNFILYFCQCVFEIDFKGQIINSYGTFLYIAKFFSTSVEWFCIPTSDIWAYIYPHGLTNKISCQIFGSLLGL